MRHYKWTSEEQDTLGEMIDYIGENYIDSTTALFDYAKANNKKHWLDLLNSYHYGFIKLCVFSPSTAKYERTKKAHELKKQGKSNKEIATALKVTERSVQRYLRG